MTERRPQRRAKDEGATTVEVAFVMSIFLVVLFGIIEFAVDLWIWQGMMLGVEQGGRAAMVYCQNPNNKAACVNPCGSGLTSYVQSAASLPANASLQTPTCIAAASPIPAKMTIKATYTVGSLSFPGIGGNSWGIPGFTLTTQATVPLN